MNEFNTNPLGFAYNSTSGIEKYAKPGGMLVTGRTNRYDDAFKNVRDEGCEVLAYINVVEIPDTFPGDLDRVMYTGAEYWPYSATATQPFTYRVNYLKNKMCDITVGSSWSTRMVNYITNMMIENELDGVFLDVLGARLWSTLANWKEWHPAEKDAFTKGCVDFVRRLDEARRKYNPKFIIVNNNTWFRDGNYIGLEGEKYVNGICLEHHPATSVANAAIAARSYGGDNLGKRRVLSIARDSADAKAWAECSGVTHVSDQASYGAVSTPPIPFNRLDSSRK